MLAAAPPVCNTPQLPPPIQLADHAVAAVDVKHEPDTELLKQATSYPQNAYNYQ